jgi:hypothetical protein
LELEKREKIAREAEKERNRLLEMEKSDAAKALINAKTVKAKCYMTCTQCGINSDKHSSIESELLALRLSESTLKKERDALMKIVVQLKRADKDQKPRNAFPIVEALKRDIQDFKENAKVSRTQGKCEQSAEVKRMISERNSMLHSGFYTASDWLIKQMDGKIQELSI